MAATEIELPRPVKFRKLRIAWSVGWGLVAVLLCVLWVRSYWWVEVYNSTDCERAKLNQLLPCRRWMQLVVQWHSTTAPKRAKGGLSRLP